MYETKPHNLRYIYIRGVIKCIYMEVKIFILLPYYFHNLVCMIYAIIIAALVYSKLDIFNIMYSKKNKLKFFFYNFVYYEL